MLEGIAKPTPSEPPDSLSIWALTPTTRPLPSSSGPPEFPWLIAASVWIVSVIVKLLGAVIWRWSALTIPLVTVPSSPNGLPIATTGSPTRSALESPSRKRLEHGCGSVDLEDCEVGRAIGADQRRRVRRAVGEADGDPGGAGDDVLVRDDVAVLVVDEAGALRGLAAAAARCRDLDDALVRALVDGRDGEVVGRGRGLGVGDRHLAYFGGLVVEHGVGRGACAEAEAERGHEAGDDEGSSIGVRCHASCPFPGSRSMTPALVE